MQFFTQTTYRAFPVRRTVAVNERGLRIGEDHQRARLTNAEVELIRVLHDEGLSYKILAEKFDCSKSLIAGICRYERRGQTAMSYKTVHIPDA